MNYPQKQFDKLVKLLPIICNHYGITKEVAESTNVVTLMHDLHFRVYVNTNYPADNANVIKKEDGVTRLLAFDETFLLYPDRCNDNQIETAMRKAFKVIFS